MVFFLQMKNQNFKKMKIIFQGQFVGTEDLNATNANYERIIAIMNELLTERYKDYCTCTRCRCDIAAIALNYLPPHYIVETDAGKEYGSPWVMIETTVIHLLSLAAAAVATQCPALTPLFLLKTLCYERILSEDLGVHRRRRYGRSHPFSPWGDRSWRGKGACR